jgi:hypothetical protein
MVFLFILEGFMNVQSINTFSNLIGHLNEHNYLVNSQETYAIADEETDQVLNLKDITNKIEDATCYLLDRAEEGYEEIEDSLHRLCHALISYISHLKEDEDKELILFCLSDIEKRLLRFNESTELKNDVVDKIFRLGHTCCYQDVKKLILFHQQILATKTEVKELYGLNPTYPLQEIISDLEQYGQQNRSRQIRLTSLIDELKTAKSISRAMDNFYDKSREFICSGEEISKEVLQIRDDIAHEIYKKISELSLSKEGNCSSLILPMGSAKHTVYFKIKLEEDGYTFTIFNTGEGAFFEETNEEDPPLISMIKLTQLSLEKLSEEFLKELIMCTIEDDVELIDDCINKWLYSEKLNNVTTVRTQKAQPGGSCATKAIMSLLRESLGDAEVRQFKAWLTAKKIDWLQTIENKLKPEFFQKELADAKEALARRTRKATEKSKDDLSFWKRFRFSLSSSMIPSQGVFVVISLLFWFYIPIKDYNDNSMWK